MSECDSQREEAVQHVEDMFPEMEMVGGVRLSPREHHQESSHDLMIMISRSISFESHATRSHIQLGKMTRDKLQR
jgi:hypothetical protein